MKQDIKKTESLFAIRLVPGINIYRPSNAERMSILGKRSSLANYQRKICGKNRIIGPGLEHFGYEI